ncbi:MAG: hypothetical protein M0024_03380 [Nitrospiraceae bacterium]|nr:hypothetical protein [Nitrospiraceae bacterium]
MTDPATKYCRLISVIFMVFSLAALSPASDAAAGLLMDAGIQGVYEDNITGSSADIGKKGDTHTVLSASVGGYKNIGRGTFAFLRANAEAYVYRRYSDLDAAIAGLSAGVYKEFDRIWSAAGSVAIKDETYRDSDRNSTAYVGAFNLRQQVRPALWIKEGYEFEKNEADCALFSYNSHLLGIWTGYSVTPQITATLGYSYIRRTYDEPAGYRNLFHTFSAGLTGEIAPKLYLTGNYDRQYIDSTIPAENHTDNIYTLGLSYSY